MNSRRKRKSSKKRAERVCFGLAWYDHDQWHRLREVADDPEALDDTYEQWLRANESFIRQMQRDGVTVERVPIDIAELVAWCRSEQRPLDGDARSEYAVRKLQGRHEGGGTP